jgi:hypothetical protein
MDKRNDMMVAIGPAWLIRRDFHEAMKNLRDALKTLRRLQELPEGKNQVVGGSSLEVLNDVGVARELLEPILRALDGMSPPPPRQSKRPSRRDGRRTAQRLEDRASRSNDDVEAHKTLH